MVIKAYTAKKASSCLELCEYPLPALNDTTVGLEVKCCGLCHSDLHMINNDWNFTSYPHVPGHEVIGKVIWKGNEVKNLNLGDLVGVGWQSGACLNCLYCLEGKENSCSHKLRTSVDGLGGFADRLYVDYRFTYRIPPNLDLYRSAPLLCAGITVYSPFKTHQIQAPMKVGIIGIGGLGHLALQFSRAFGCETTALSSSTDKRESIKALGAQHFIDISDPSSLRRKENSFDFLLSTVNISLPWTELIQMLKPGGVFCFVGIPKLPIEFPARSLITKNRILSGSGTGSRSTMIEMLEFCALHHIEAEVELFPMAEVNQALHHLKENKVRYRIVLYN